eukprot:TRINITY_DN113054_c0_g1_i1.p2 TRINITY_DN113054_c0_g1~~TRINITY_DN113054_c0_g1_i1.p2  ORF type:complete len:218 (-),score=35.10 TRINITY_DN113054_c0_g1_i1:1225-1878(-)
MAETLVGIACKDHVMVMGSSQAVAHGILQLKATEDKLAQVADNKILAAIGETGDRTHLCEYIARNQALNTHRQDGRMNTAPATAAFIRRTLANSLRSRSPFYCHVLFAAFDPPLPELERLKKEGKEVADDGSGSYLYWMDYLGTQQRAPYAAHGVAGSFCIAVLDRYWKVDQTEKESYELLKRCVEEIRSRISVNNPRFTVKVIDASGKVRELDAIQ